MNALKIFCILLALNSELLFSNENSCLRIIGWASRVSFQNFMQHPPSLPIFFTTILLSLIFRTPSPSCLSITHIRSQISRNQTVSRESRDTGTGTGDYYVNTVHRNPPCWLKPRIFFVCVLWIGCWLVSSMPFRFPFHLPVLFYNDYFS